MTPHSRRDLGFEKPLMLPGWAGTARWGYDAVLECYWAEADHEAVGTVRIGPEHLLVTLGSLARTIAAALGLTDQEAYLALLSSRAATGPASRRAA